jgi:hypothetical protein
MDRITVDCPRGITRIVDGCEASASVLLVDVRTLDDDEAVCTWEHLAEYARSCIPDMSNVEVMTYDPESL